MRELWDLAGQVQNATEQEEAAPHHLARRRRSFNQSYGHASELNDLGGDRAEEQSAQCAQPTRPHHDLIGFDLVRNPDDRFGNRTQLGSCLEFDCSLAAQSDRPSQSLFRLTHSSLSIRIGRDDRGDVGNFERFPTLNIQQNDLGVPSVTGERQCIGDGVVRRRRAINRDNDSHGRSHSGIVSPPTVR